MGAICPLVVPRLEEGAQGMGKDTIAPYPVGSHFNHVLIVLFNVRAHLRHRIRPERVLAAVHVDLIANCRSLVVGRTHSVPQKPHALRTLENKPD